MCRERGGNGRNEADEKKNPPFCLIAVLFWAAFSWPFVASAQTAPELNYKVGDPAPFDSLCNPTGSGIVLRAFMEGGPDLAKTAFAEQVAAADCHVYPLIVVAELAEINYIGFFHKYHLFALRFGDGGFHIRYFGPYEAVDPSPNTKGRERPFNPMDREA